MTKIKFTSMHVYLPNDPNNPTSPAMQARPQRTTSPLAGAPKPQKTRNDFSTAPRTVLGVTFARTHPNWQNRTMPSEPSSIETRPGHAGPDNSFLGFDVDAEFESLEKSCRSEAEKKLDDPVADEKARSNRAILNAFKPADLVLSRSLDKGKVDIHLPPAYRSDPSDELAALTHAAGKGGVDTASASDQAGNSEPGAAAGQAPAMGGVAGPPPELQQLIDQFTVLLGQNGVATFKEGAKTGFQSLPQQFRPIAVQVAELVGLATPAVPPGAAVPFPQLTERLGAVNATAQELVDATRLDMTSALNLDPQQRAAALAPQLNQLKEAGKATANAVAQMPDAEMNENRKVLVDQLSTWAETAEKLHEQLRPQFGDLHPTTLVAQEASTDASVIYGKTVTRLRALQ